jgi:hypothetical protein
MVRPLVVDIILCVLCFGILSGVLFSCAVAIVERSRTTFKFGIPSLGWACLKSCDSCSAGFVDGQIGLDLTKAAALSVFIPACASVVSIFFLLLKAIRLTHDFHLKLVIFLLASDFLLNVKLILSAGTQLTGDSSLTEGNTPGCFAMAITGIVFGNGSQLWNLVLNMNLLLMVGKPTLYQRISVPGNWLLLLYILFAWGINGVLAVTGFFARKLGQSTGQCYFQASWARIVNIEQILASISAVGAVAFTMNRMGRTLMGIGSATSTRAIRQLCVFCVSFFFSWFWVSVFWLSHFTSPGPGCVLSAYLLVAYNLSLGSVGFVNATVWYVFISRHQVHPSAVGTESTIGSLPTVTDMTICDDSAEKDTLTHVEGDGADNVYPEDSVSSQAAELPNDDCFGLESPSFTLERVRSGVN